MRLNMTALVLVDLILAWCAFYCGLLLRFGAPEAQYDLVNKPFLRSILFACVLVTVSYILEAYVIEKIRSSLKALITCCTIASFSFLVLSVVLFVNPHWMIGRGVLVLALASFIPLQFCGHRAFRILLKLPYLTEHVVVLGTGELAREVGKLIETSSWGGVHQILKGYLECSEGHGAAPSVPEGLILGTVRELDGIVKRAGATSIIVTDTMLLKSPHFQNELLNCKMRGIDVVDLPTFHEKVSGKLMLENMDSFYLTFSVGFRRNPLSDTTKRAMDICLATLGMILCIPLLPLIALLVKLNSPGPTFYRQVRVGYLAHDFTLYKFRTMGLDAEEGTGAVWAAEDDPRIRPIGRFLRKFRLDEIPQLYNVLRGEMSFVGPRPERPEFVRELDQAIPYYAKRHFIKPGITGWAQIKVPYGASAEDAYEKLRYDLYYFKNMGLLLDTHIFMQTFRVIFSQFGGR